MKNEEGKQVYMHALPITEKFHHHVYLFFGKISAKEIPWQLLPLCEECYTLIGLVLGVC